MNAVESVFYEISKLFLMPVLIVLALFFLYAFFAAGAFLVEWGRRALARPGGRPLHRHAAAHPGANQEALELHLLKLIEPLRIVSRVAPMLGLVATMIPMGPALIAVSSGNAQGMAQNLVVAFAAVVIALVSAAITYVILSVRRRWLLAELNELLDRRGQHGPAPASPAGMPPHAAGVVHG
ncbi:MotA/TolQ/ExbB proton channel family protein [Pseudorhodoferax sp.]|uniref:MotA/TolQ/ExbB proton channel family protein n=1 Tax=Pseudorhodoferax sp. TaxID=1993553 RepID=UPI0039E2B756